MPMALASTRLLHFYHASLIWLSEHHWEQLRNQTQTQLLCSSSVKQSGLARNANENNYKYTKNNTKKHSRGRGRGPGSAGPRFSCPWTPAPPPTRSGRLSK